MPATTDQLEAQIDHIAAAPSDVGTVELVVARPADPLAIGTAIIEVTTKPHHGCAKFSDRYGIDAARWINSRNDLRLRGVCAIVVESGTVAPGDTITKR